jgi:hypothetical protein
MLLLPHLSSLLICHLPLCCAIFFFLLRPPLPLVPLRCSYLDVLNTYVGYLIVTLLRLLLLLLFLSQLLIMMLFFIQNDNMRWLRRLLPLSGLARGILCHVPHVFARSPVSGYIRLRLALMVLLNDIRLILLLIVFSKSIFEIMMSLLLMLLI